MPINIQYIYIYIKIKCVNYVFRNNSRILLYFLLNILLVLPSHMIMFQEEFHHGHLFLQLMMKTKEFIYVYGLKMLFKMRYIFYNSIHQNFLI